MQKQDPSFFSSVEKRQQDRSLTAFLVHLHCSAANLLTVVLIRDGQLLAAMLTTAGEHATAVLRCHTLTETVLVHAAAVVGLKCSFHCCSFILIYCIIAFIGDKNPVTGCKITHNFRDDKELNVFSSEKHCFFIKS